MALEGTLICLLSFAVWCSAAQDETVHQNCSSHSQLSAALKVAVECGDDLPWSAEQTAALLLSMRTLTSSLYRQQLKECNGTQPQQCPQPQVPDDGALACVTMANNRYCKPMCNDGYDFGFMRRSRLYDVCSEQTGYKWSTQYVGGDRLAVCNRESLQVSGAKTAYFPKDQDCLTTKSSSQLQDGIMGEFVSELTKEGVQGEPQYACLVCGHTRGA